MDNIIMVINIYLPLDKESNSTLDTGHWTVTEFSRREKISMCLVPGGCWWLLVRLCKGARYVTLAQHHTCSHTVQRAPVITCTLPASPDITGSGATAMVFSAINISEI